MDEHVKANQKLWNLWTPYHVRSQFYDVEGVKAGRVRQRHGVDHLHARLVGDVRGKTLLHLQCHFGLDTIAWAQRGATVTGIDFSIEAIQAARAAPNRFVRNKKARMRRPTRPSTAFSHARFLREPTSSARCCALDSRSSRSPSIPTLPGGCFRGWNNAQTAAGSFRVVPR